MNLSDLHKPFPPEAVSWRVGSTTKNKSKGLALAYIDARDVMKRIDEVCGAHGWQDRYEFHGTRTICYLSIRIGDEWITKADGAGDSDVEAEKGSISDAFKRAAVKWGVGRYLYDLESPWVELDTKTVGDKIYVNGIKKSEFPRLEAILRGGPAPAPAPALRTPDAEEITEYCVEFNKQLKLCKNRFDVEKAWKNATERRANLGIALGDDDYQRLIGFCQDRIKEFDPPQAPVEAA